MARKKIVQIFHTHKQFHPTTLIWLFTVQQLLIRWTICNLPWTSQKSKVKPKKPIFGLLHATWVASHLTHTKGLRATASCFPTKTITSTSGFVGYIDPTWQCIRAFELQTLSAQQYRILKTADLQSPMKRQEPMETNNCNTAVLGANPQFGTFV